MSRRQRRRSRPPPPGRSRLQRRRLLTHSYLRHHLKHRRRAATVMYAERAGFGTRLPPRCQAHARAQCGRWPNVVTTHARPGCIATTRCRVQAKAPAGRVPGRNQTVQSQPMATGPLLSSWHLLTHVHASHVCPPPPPAGPRPAKHIFAPVCPSGVATSQPGTPREQASRDAPAAGLGPRATGMARADPSSAQRKDWSHSVPSSRAAAARSHRRQGACRPHARAGVKKRTGEERITAGDPQSTNLYLGSLHPSVRAPAVLTVRVALELLGQR